MKTYQLLLCMSLCGGLISEINGNGSDFQKPHSKWAWAQSYSWVVSSDGNDFDPLKLQQAQVQQAQVQQALQQQALQQQAQIQQAMQQQSLQQRVLQEQALQQQAQIREAQIQQTLQHQSLQQQALQQQAQTKEFQIQQALQQRIQLEAVENVQLNNDAFSPHRSNSIRDSTVNELTRRSLSNFQTENVTPFSSNQNENLQVFIEEIVQKVIQETRGKFDIPTTRQDIEKIVRRILQENSSMDASRKNSNRYRDNGQDSNYNQNSNGMNQAECVFNCGNGVNSYKSEEPNAVVAVASSFSSLGRSRDPRVIANSFTFTSV